ncbi:MAG: C4-dicarboxylate transporter DcuC [Bacteroidales bacterium]|nr:C4-dicarboxylate transporter DcuC [Bacteroidales bacterium]
MVYVGGLLAIHFLALTLYLITRRFNASLTLLLMGMVMYFLAYFLGLADPIEVSEKSGFLFFDFLKHVTDSFVTRFGNTGLQIMLIGGYVEYMKKIRANDALIYVSMQPLSILRQNPYLAAIMIIPIGQVLFITTSSAVSLGLLMMTTIYPVLIGLGVSRLTAVSVIAACTVFDMGPTSSNTFLAHTSIGLDSMTYFTMQLRVTLPMTVLLMILLYFSNRYYDRKAGNNSRGPVKALKMEELRSAAPLWFAILPTLPLLFTVLFSKSVNLLGLGIYLDLAPVILLSMAISVMAEYIRRKSLRDLFATITPFWVGMGRIFASVIVLIVCAEIFAQGLLNLKLIDMMVGVFQFLGLNFIFVIFLLAMLVFTGSLVTGSGVASFTAIGQYVPELSMRFGIPSIKLMIPVQLAAGLGRAASPISAILIAISEIAGVSPFEVARRNLIPFLIIAVLMVFASYIYL